MRASVAYLVVWMVALTSANSVRNVPGAPCSIDNHEDNVGVYLPHPVDCTLYLKCEHGFFVTLSCPPLLHWNAEKIACDWPQLANCDPNAVAPELPPWQPPGEHPEGPGSTVPGEIGGACVVFGEEDNNLGNYRVHPLSCELFLKCDNGILIERPCPPGLHWNAVERTCDWPNQAQCTVGGNVPPGPQGFSDFMAIAPMAGACPAEDDPEAGAYLAHPDCSLYYQCEHGIPHTRDCPDGLQWNAALTVCDWPWRAECIDGAAPEQEDARPLVPRPPPGDNGNDGPISQIPGAYTSCPVDILPYTVLLPHPSCALFYMCVHGVAHEQQCPGGLHWNIAVTACDWVDLALCIENAAPPQANAVRL